jgi:hypothetical protein
MPLAKLIRQIDTKIAALAKMLKITDANFSAERTSRESGYFLYAAQSIYVRRKPKQTQYKVRTSLKRQNVDVDWENYEYDSAQ